jgi:hypothetical protein
MQKSSQATRFSRRQWAAALTGALAPLAGRAQAPARPPSLLEAQRDSLRQHQDAVRRAKVPRETEPAFRFQA